MNKADLLLYLDNILTDLVARPRNGMERLDTEFAREARLRSAIRDLSVIRAEIAIKGVTNCSCPGQ